MPTIDMNWLLEQIDTECPGDMTVAPGATEATLNFIVPVKYLYDTYRFVLGFAKLSDKQWAANTQGGLTREIEMSHPRYPNLYAESISLEFLKPGGKVDPLTIPAVREQLNANDNQGKTVFIKTFDNVAVYDFVRMKVRFTGRNYLLLTDDQLENIIVNNDTGNVQAYGYYLRDKNAIGGVKAAQYIDYREYLRFCEVNIEPSSDIIVNGTGKGFYKSQQQGFDAENTNPKTDSPVNSGTAGMVFQTLVKNIVKITWYKVPKIAMFNRMYSQFVGTCNFGPNYNDDAGEVAVWNYPFFNFAPGTLLYTGMDIEDFNSSFPTSPWDGQTVVSLALNNIENQYVNITFRFVQYVIPQDQIVLPSLEYIEPGKGKMYSNGWNFVPSANRWFYYVENQRIADKFAGFPLYFSFPFQALFDPQYTGWA